MIFVVFRCLAFMESKTQLDTLTRLFSEKMETFNKSSDRELRIVAQRKSRALKLTDVACLSMGSLLGYLAGLSGDG